MPDFSKKRRLKKELGLFDVYAIATGTTLSAGFFLLPGLAAQQVGPALVLAYMIAAIPLIPAMFSIVELATAMPRAGGVYYFLDRSLGPLVGTVGGLGTWIALMLKVAFALVGMGAYIRLFLPDLPILPVAVALALILGALNLFGARKSGQLQAFLVVGLLTILVAFIGGGVLKIQPAHFSGLFDAGWSSILSTAGFVYISYVGVTKVASLSEEVKNPEKNLPLGVFLALATAITIYGLGTAVMVGVVPMDKLVGDLTPVATAAEILAGPWGVALVTGAALFAFLSVANAGILSASRYPLAMSRDRLLPRSLRRLAPGRIPRRSMVLTVGLIILILVLLDPTKIAKLASTFQLLMFALVCLAVIVMRESGIEAYDPGYRSPWYPWMQWIGILVPFGLIAAMGWLPLAFSAALILGSALWYWLYAARRVSRHGAIFHYLAKLAEPRVDYSLERELRHILREKGLRDEDPFDQVVATAFVIDLDDEGGDAPTFEAAALRAATLLSERLPATAEELNEGFLEAIRIGAMPVSHGVSLPHLRLIEISQPEMVLVRSREGIAVHLSDIHGEQATTNTIFASFFLVSPEEDPRQHLRILAQLAERVDDEAFLDEWSQARNEQELKEILLRDDRFLSLTLSRSGPGRALIDRPLRELPIPEGALVALIRRRGEIVVPRGGTVLEEKDRVTILGQPAQIRQLRQEFQ